MKGLFQKITAGIVVSAMTIAAVPAGKAGAEAEHVPGKVRVYTGGTRSVDFSLKDDVKVKKVSSSNKNLIVKLTSGSYYKRGGELESNRYAVELYGKKDGNSVVTIRLSDGSSRKIRVYSYGYPYSYQVNGKKNNYLHETKKKSAKVKVSLEKGNKLQGVSYSVTKKKKNDTGYETTTTYKAFKNGGKIPLNAQPYEYKRTYSDPNPDYPSESESAGSSLWAYTTVKLKYKDKYTKQTEECQISVASKLIR